MSTPHRACTTVVPGTLRGGKRWQLITPGAVLGLLLWLVALPALAQLPVPPLRSPVTDLTGTLTAEQTATLEQRLRTFEAAKGSQIAVLVVPTTQPETIEQYAVRVANAWRLGRKGVEDGVLLVLAKQDRAVRIEVGRGLEGVLPDVLAYRVIDRVIVPQFRSGDFFGGLWQGVERIIAVIEGEPLPEALARESAAEDSEQFLPVALFLLLMGGGGLLRRLFGSLGGAAAIALLAGLFAWTLTRLLLVGAGVGIVAFLFALFTGRGGGGGWSSSRRGRGRGAWGGFGGWGGGSWGGGGGGGGGWSGGGGSFGGGGASGRW